MNRETLGVAPDVRVAVGMDLTHHLAVDDVREGITTMLEARYGGLLLQ